MPILDLPQLNPTDASPGDRILILGAGYAGLRLAQTLGKLFDEQHSPEVVLIDRYSYHQVITELPEAASGRIAQEEVALPLDTLLHRSRVRFEQAEVQRIDPDARQVITTRGAIAYGTLVVALGSVTAFYNVPGLVDNALTLKSVEDTDTIKTRVTQAVEQAAQTTDPAAQAALLSVLIGGAGLTGVELAGELAELLPDLAREHGLDPRAPKVTLVEAAPAVLPSMPERLQQRAAAILTDLRVRLVTGGRVIVADDAGLQLASGDRLIGRTLVWTGGIMAPPLLAQSGLPTGHNGHVPVDSYLRAEGYDDVYVIGDAAQILDQSGEGVLAPTAQVALKQAEVAAYNIAAGREGWALRRYHPSDKGQVVSLGTERGVASIFHIPLSGRKVIALKTLIAEAYRVEVTGSLFGRGRQHAAHQEA
ncbi:MAG TPA: NAD(P)/FAD-dependent oxidoreductase [Chloroflexota bacterium]|jgi:NADH dehydrogenase|nr:NAD(P)/FAD-dependent oxidoreductase [Chloroflexota bacterium]